MWSSDHTGHRRPDGRWRTACPLTSLLLIAPSSTTSLSFVLVVPPMELMTCELTLSHRIAFTSPRRLITMSPHRLVVRRLFRNLSQATPQARAAHQRPCVLLLQARPCRPLHRLAVGSEPRLPISWGFRVLAKRLSFWPVFIFSCFSCFYTPFLSILFFLSTSVVTTGRRQA